MGLYMQTTTQRHSAAARPAAPFGSRTPPLRHSAAAHPRSAIQLSSTPTTRERAIRARPRERESHEPRYREGNEKHGQRTRENGKHTYRPYADNAVVMTDRTVNIQQNRPELHVRHVCSLGRWRDEDGSAMASSETRVAAAPSAAAPRGRRGRDANLVPPGKNDWWR